MPKNMPEFAFKLGVSAEERESAALDHMRKAKGRIPAWSESALQMFETCPYQLYLKRVERLPEEKSDAAERGTKMHDMAEAFVRGTIEDSPAVMAEILPKRPSPIEDILRGARERFAEQPERFVLEDNWGFRIDWSPCGWFDDDVWARVKLDLFEFHDDAGTAATVTDHKSGRMHGNEYKHGQQAITYAVATAMKYPTLQRITTRFTYLDQAETSEKNFSRSDLDVLRPRVERRALKLTSATEFPPKPSRGACRFCSYRKSGDCEYAMG